MNATEGLLALSAGLFLTGLFGLTARRPILMQLIALEIMLAGPALAFVAAGAARGMVEGTGMFLLVLGLAAAEVAVGLGLYLRLRALRGSTDSDAAHRLRE